MSQNQNQFGFFDNPPNMRCQKKTGHFADKFSEDFESVQPDQSTQFNGFEQTYQGLEWRQSQQESRIPDFTKPAFGKISLVVGRRQSGKTTLIKGIIQREVERLKHQAIINHFPKVIIVTQSINHRQAYSDCRSFQNTSMVRDKEGWEYIQFIESIEELAELVKKEAVDNSLVVIEDDVVLDEFLKSSGSVKSFFADIQRRNMTLIMALSGLPKINSQVASAVDYLFLCKNLPYCELQRIGNAFLSIKLPSFIRIYSEIVINNDSIAVVDISPENLRPNTKSNIKQQNMMKLLYKYPFTLQEPEPEFEPCMKPVLSLPASSQEQEQPVDDEPVTTTDKLLEKTIVQTIDDVVFNLNLLKTQLGQFFQDKSSAENSVKNNVN